jgi:small multidrug resistance family-3 protein
MKKTWLVLLLIPIRHNIELNSFTIILVTLLLFVFAAILEIGGGYLVWQWIKEKRKFTFGLLGGFVLFIYGVIPTLQPSNFARVYAAYGGIFVIMTIAWGFFIDKKRPDKYEIIGGIIVTLGAAIIFYFPR